MTGSPTGFCISNAGADLGFGEGGGRGGGLKEKKAREAHGIF